MASWKEKGIVPDSDDEDDTLDSQETLHDEPTQHANDLTIRNVGEHHDSDSEDELSKDGYGLQFAREAEHTTKEPGLPKQFRDTDEPPLRLETRLPSEVPLGIPADDGGASAGGGSSGNTKRDGTSPLSGSLPKRVFKFPPGFINVGNRDSFNENRNPSPERDLPQPELSRLIDIPADEISTSYVQVSSPLSSPPIPPPDTTSRNEEPRQSLSRYPLLRSLRPRAPIQMQPFTLEMGQYRKTVWGAGIKTYRMSEEEQEEERRRRQAEESQEDSQDRPFETEEDSQMTDLMATEHPLSSSQPQPVFDDSDDPFRPFDFEEQPLLNRQVPRNNEPNRFSDIMDDTMGDEPPTLNDNEDSDDLPDISDILKGPRTGRVDKSGKRKRPRTYKTNRSVVPTTSNELNDEENSRGHDIFDFPFSPPVTSPAVLSDPTKRILERVSSVGSKKSSPLNNIRNDRPGVSEVPTPAASATGIPSDQIVFSLESDSEDHISSAGPSRTPSPEPEDRMRRVAKRIRGVLPASWLRLDQKPQTPTPSTARVRESTNPSPEKSVPQRGVAIPKPVRGTAPSTPGDAVNTFFLDDESESDEELPGGVGAELEVEETSQFDQSLAGSLFDDAIEDNRVDRMLPPRKRKSTGSSNRPSKMRRVSSKLFHGNGSGYARQPKITEQFERSHNTSKHNPKPTENWSGQKTQRRKPARKPPVKKFVPPNLSILDSVEPGSQAFKDAPAFIRIASRTAKSRKRLGRHSPSRKFIRLANIDDTNDAQSVLRDWREGTILPNKSLRYPQPLPRSVQRRDSLGQQTRLPAPQSRTVAPKLHVREKGPRKLTLSKRQQTTLDGVVTTIEHQDSTPTRSVVHLPPIRRNVQLLHDRPPAQPAQLETEERDYNRNHPNAGFGTTKKGLDRLFRRSHRGAAVKGDVQLARFLADPDVVGSVVDDISHQADILPSTPDVVEFQPPQPRRRRKGSPRHLDAGAQKYRQPSEPLPLESYFVPADINSAASGGGKLLGLQPYGTRYTYHFDIFPLQFGVFFHESTFIGSGQLSRVLDESSVHRDYRARCSPCLYHLDEKDLRWAEWDANVSSEIGLCFDWISGQLEAGAPPAVSVSQLVDFIIKYVEQHLFFEGQDDQQHFVRRVCDVVDGFLTRTCAAENTTTIQPMIEISSRLLVLLMQILRMCQQPNIDFSLREAVEDSLQRACECSAAFLVSLGLDKVRDFYEECQYLTSRESGVRRNRYYIEAWVIMMKVMQAAQIPQSLFWDIVNKRLLKANLDAADDAQVLETIWYNMFSLIPLTEFDEAGVIHTGLRHITSFENWALPQKLMKRVFTIYALKMRQSAGFNDYVRSLFIRCHHLMVEWGWRRCGPLIGILFDFFASHNLAHLRNEESFTSPRFLEQLNVEPSLSVETDDKCFHIFLKIVATSIKHLRQAGDTKGVRNLVTRLLPNHDRQYPKEEAIHQRDLASLRNHHDLLCTLFWAAPMDSRPITLLRQLVIPERSHREACLINLKAWSNVSKFLLATSPIPEEYQKLVDWQHDVFSRLVYQYQSAEAEIRQQHAALSTTLQRQHSEQSICDTIDKNKEQAIEQISCHLHAINLQMKDAKNIEIAKTIFMAGRALVTSVIGLFGNNPSACDRSALETALQFVEYYFSKTENYQQSLPVSEYEEREAMILGKAGCLSVFDDKFLGTLERIVGQMLEKKLNGINEKLVVEVWAKISACQARREDFFKNNVTILQTRVGEWISGHEYPAGSRKQAETYAPLFIAVFLQQVPAQVFKRSISQRNMFQEWLCSIAKPSERFRFEYHWTMSAIQAHQLPSSLLRDKSPYLPRHIVSISSRNRPLYTINESSEESKFGLSILKKDQFTIIEGVIKYISDAYKDSSSKSDSAQNRRYLANILQSLMATLKDHYTSAHENQTTASINYQQFVRQVVSSIKTYANDVCPLDRFFTDAGTIYYHLTADGPNYFVPTMIHHSLHVSERGGEAKFFYYCWESIKVMVRRQESGRLPGLLVQIMDHDLKSKELVMGATRAVSMILAPAAVWAAWQVNEGFFIADMFLRVVEEQVLVVASINIGMAAEMAVPAILHIVHGAWRLYASSTTLISRPHLYLITRVIRFMTALWDLLAMASISIGDLPALLQQFATFTKAAAGYYEDKALIPKDARFHGNSPFERPISEPSFGKVILDEYKGKWEYRDGRVWVRTGSGARAMNVSSYSATGEVLVRGVGGEDALAEEKDLVNELVDSLETYNGLSGDGKKMRRRDMTRAVVGLEDVGL